MIALSTIQAAVHLGTAYYLELLSDLREDLIDGCENTCQDKILCLSSAVIALQYDIDTESNTDRTTRVYNLLLGIIANYSGSYSPDPDVVIENTTITVTSSNETLNKSQADLIDADPPNGNWYLPFLDNDGNPLPSGYTPTYVLYNGVTLPGFTYVASENRIYGFSSNEPANIQVLVEYITP